MPHPEDPRCHIPLLLSLLGAIIRLDLHTLLSTVLREPLLVNSDLTVLAYALFRSRPALPPPSTHSFTAPPQAARGLPQSCSNWL